MEQKRFLFYKVCNIKIFSYICPLLSKQQRMLQGIRSQIKLTRLRCNITSLEVAQGTSLDHNTIAKIEAEDESVVIGSYFNVWIA